MKQVGEESCPTQDQPPRRPQEGRVTRKVAMPSPVKVGRLCPTPPAATSQTSPTRWWHEFPPGHHRGNRGRKEVRWAGLGHKFCDPHRQPARASTASSGPGAPGALLAGPGQILGAKLGYGAAGQIARNSPTRPLCAFRKQLHLFQTWGFLIREMLLKIDLPHPSGHREDGERKNKSSTFVHCMN